MPKPLFILIGVSFAAVGVAVFSGAFYVGNLYLAKTAVTQDQVATCKQSYANHRVIISHDAAQPKLTQADLCDTLTITNTDKTIRLMAFGPHTHHVPYDGVTEKVLGPGQSLSVQLNQVGTYQFHDHIHDEVTGQFAVSSDPSRIKP